METLRLDNVTKIYKGKNRKEGDVIAVKDFNLVVEDNEFIVFVGPSGCGKSTTLRMIAGLEDISSGNLYIDGELVNKIEPNYRNVAMVFQNYALYPHMSAYKNMAFGLKNRHVPKEEIDQRIHEAAKVLDIEDLLNRKPKAMSGGQRQRVALGRAIVRTPKIFLLDEPLSNLDAKLRAQMRVEINKLYEKLKTTFIYVTHDQVEAMTMGTRIVVMRKGIVQQIDTPTTLYDFPRNRFVAGFLGTPQMNFYEVDLKVNENKVYINLFDKELIYPLEKFREFNKDFCDGNEHKVILGIRPDNVSISENGELECKVNIIETLGNECLVYSDFDLNNETSINESLSSLVISLKDRTTFKMGDIIKVSFDPTKIHFFKDEESNEISILLTPRTKLNEISGYIYIKDNKAFVNIDEGFGFELVNLDVSKINGAYKEKMHRVKILINDGVSLDSNGTISLRYEGKGLIGKETLYRYELNPNKDYETSFYENSTHIYLKKDLGIKENESAKVSFDFNKVEVIGDDKLSIFDLNKKEKELDKYDFVEVKEEVESTNKILKLFKKEKSKEEVIESLNDKDEVIHDSFIKKIKKFCKNALLKFKNILHKN